MQQHCLEHFDNLMLIFHKGWIPTADFQVFCGNCDVSLVQVTGGRLICFYEPNSAVSLTRVKGLTTSLITYQTLWCCSAFLRVCWGGLFITRALTRGQSGTDMNHIRQGSAWHCSCIQEVFPSLLIHWTADIYGKTLTICCNMLNKQRGLYPDLMLWNTPPQPHYLDMQFMEKMPSISPKDGGWGPWRERQVFPMP